ncbi:hypothetical protein BC628DRAFT_1334091, partial [Trametes gibbosa]
PPPTAPAELLPPTLPTASESPSDFLKGLFGERVVARLTSGVDYHCQDTPAYDRMVLHVP